jgi:lactoylglutathione lyase
MRAYTFLCALLAGGGLAAADLPVSGLAAVRFKVSDVDKAKAFYAGILGLDVAFEREGLVAFQVNENQFVEIAGGLAPEEDERLEQVVFEARDLYALRTELNRRGVPVTMPQTTPEGNRAVQLTDPDGHRIVFMQFMPGSAHRAATLAGNRRISTRLMHAGVSVAHQGRGLAFWRDKLGFVETWRGGPENQPVRWINLRAPGARGDYIELMLHDQPPTRQQLGSMHHICLEVADIEAARKEVVARGAPANAEARIGRNRRWQLNLFDPDGTRTELMEPKAVE